MSAQTAPPQYGIPCPQCSFVIPVAIHMLLSSAPIVCPICGLALHVDEEKSAESIKLVHKVYEAMQNVEQTRRQWE